MSPAGCVRAGLADLSVAVGVEAGLVPWDGCAKGFADSEVEVGVFDIKVVHHCVEAG
jgi:hypothetical protein